MKYEIKGGNFPVLVCTLLEEEAMITQGGAMSWMSPNIMMETIGGGVKNVLGRMISNETMFQNKYTAKGSYGMIAFSSSYPGEIIPIEITEGMEYIFQKGAFLASTSNIETSVHFRKKLSTSLFGGEGFVMEKANGAGVLFLEVDGGAMRYPLQEGQQIVVDTGHIVMISGTCQMDVVPVKGVKNALFGGEGLFNTVITGPGEVLVQTMPVQKLAQAISPYLPQPPSN